MSDADTDALVGGMADSAAAGTAAPGGETTAPVSNGGTILDGDAADKPVTAPADWPQDWRTKLAGEDKSYLKTLDRFNSPSDLAKAYRDAQQRLSSGSLRSVLSENPTPEELSAWRTENGVPETADGYKFEVGYQWGENDRPVLESFAAYAHENNIPKQYAEKIAAYYAATQQNNLQLIEDFDAKNHQAGEDALRAEWGQEYRRNINAIKNTLSAHAPEDVVANMLASRTPDGRRWGDSPEMLKIFASLAREANPTATVVPANGFGTMDDELGALEKKVGTKEYWADPKMQARYTELLAARIARENRGRAA